MHRAKFTRDPCSCALLLFDQLDQVEKKILAEQVFLALRSNSEHDPYDVISCVFYEWGVMCLHPEHKRERINSLFFTCGSCGCMIFERSFDPSNDKKYVIL